MQMKGYAVGNLRHVVMGPPIVAYLERIDATLAPFGGRFLIHGGEKTVVEGAWSADLIVIEFPDMNRARAWYGSPAYRQILPLRADNSEGDVMLISGVDEHHKATDILS
jgi:uncharacterized protein (DUF1330 family)